jgi:hypothetical protein
VEHIGNVRFHRQVIGRDENHLFIVYEITTDDPISLGSESVAIEHFTPVGLKEAISHNPQDFGDSFYFILETFYSGNLPKHYVRRWSKP